MFTVGVFLDIKKAFDCVSHAHLLRKLRHYGFSESACLLLENFLSNRSQCTRTNKSTSPPEPLVIGVPQGTVLGPILFILFINDLLIYLRKRNCFCVSYADDTTLLFSDSDISSCVTKINMTLQIISDWFLNNRLTLNACKTHYVVFQPPQSRKKIDDGLLCLGGCAIQQSSSVVCSMSRCHFELESLLADTYL